MFVLNTNKLNILLVVETISYLIHNLIKISKINKKLCNYNFNWLGLNKTVKFLKYSIYANVISLEYNILIDKFLYKNLDVFKYYITGKGSQKVFNFYVTGFSK